MIIHCKQQGFKPSQILLDGEDISEVCFLADDAAGIAFCLVPLQKVKADYKPGNYKCFALFQDAGIDIDSALYEMRMGNVEIVAQ